jgi:hypothetical protein
VHYRLANPRVARWLVEGLDFIEADLRHSQELLKAVEETRSSWSEDER